MPEHLDIGNIPVRQMTDLTVELSGKCNYALPLLIHSNFLKIIDADGYASLIDISIKGLVC